MVLWKIEMRNLTIMFTKVMARPVIATNCEEKRG